MSDIHLPPGEELLLQELDVLAVHVIVRYLLVAGERLDVDVLTGLTVLTHIDLGGRGRSYQSYTKIN